MSQKILTTLQKEQLHAKTSTNEKEAGLVFPVQVRLKQHSVRVNGQEVPLTPGMAATAEVVTRQKTVLSFLLDPITGSWDRAFSVR
ncbi:hypothetical protein H6F51_04000 [Cyanobacteria bacterium FACHB-DQ100]|uniref:hypothetical protein n=1 Tax=Leptolyngbya sp. DQ-M1 TaxID=2933920 RepID=UPI0019A9E939|nr:hypothetical protein [Cyanobacteria bacterium FACHB-DQ100]